MSNKKIIFAGLVFALFAVVVLSTNGANAAFWDWFKGGSDSAAAVAKTKTYTLKINKSSFGAVISNDGKINCGSDCTEKYNSSPVTTIILTATPQDDFSFFGWSGGGCKGTGNCIVTMNKSTTVTAKFKKNNSKSDGGTAASLATDIGTTSSALPSNPPGAGTLPTTGTCTITDDGVTVCTDTSSSPSAGPLPGIPGGGTTSSSLPKVAPTIKVVSPNGGEVWKAGTTKNIEFKGNLADEKVGIFLNWNGREGSLRIGESKTSSNGKVVVYPWEIPKTIEKRNDYLVTIDYADYKNSTAIDSSDKTFSIK